MEVWKWTSYKPMYCVEDVMNVAEMFTDEWLGAYDRPNRYSWAIQLKSSGEVIGRFFGMHPDDRLGQIELAHELGQNWWNQGLMTEAVKTVINFFFNEVGFNRICANHASENPASGKVMQKCGMIYEGIMRQGCKCNNGLFDYVNYAILAEDYFGNAQKSIEPTPTIVATLKTSIDLMFHNLYIAMDTVDWNADICGAPAWRYIYHTLHSADKYFINPSSWVEKDEPPFHSHLLDWPDTPTDTVLSKETLYAYFDKVRQKIISYIDNLNDVQLSERPGDKLTCLGLILSQFRHMYAHIGILNGITIANTQQYPRVINEVTWSSGRLPDGLYDVEERK